ncbi:aminotransferase class III-fold pyridoxal phosphate-dependent enzyme [Streptomyces sp. V2I9]|uniref:aminotransferase class III-fold pyridoxal phosphate-dependent enzyme n=1 Tax=Streptomyces sp. V2I9 TaxID=3042304 RepID=UPI0027895537|nr:aminotransferase class III-fold pyridoxal phosphate-dependent enzyme [Streptomyces sp. V2I9]MDQ0988745.1 acyl transferase domain-containing protein/glutamate-1-semialdehyde aminotransferase [Streptomyces sp. V2I9]
MQEPLAIVGMACRVPGAADYRSLWTGIETGATGMVRVGEEDRRRENISLDPEVRNRYVPVAAPLDGYDAFDNAAFGMSAGEADGLNLNGRVLMEVALSALEDAGCDPLRYAGGIGLFAAGGGASPISVVQRAGDSRYGDPARPLKISEAINWTSLLDNDYLATRVAYALDLRGPCLTVQSACSSSLVALHLAMRSVLHGDADMAVAGGVNVELPHRVGYYHQEGSIWSVDGSCRPFDADAGGTITASGAGAVVIKRLDQALADGDAVHAVIRGSALNNDGNRKVGFTAPSVTQQSRVIGAALANAGVDRREIGYLEAHGTATAIGDVVEWAAIEQALGPDGVRCALGATKANLGHLGAASGILGVIKAALVLAHGRIPPVANFRERNPQIRPKSDRLFVPESCGPWESEKPRLAGVSSMGVGGTNAHVVLEEPPVAEPVEESGELVAVLPVSAASERSAQDTAERVARFAAEHPGRLGALAHTLATGRRVLPHREAVVAVRREGEVTTWRTGGRLAKRKPAGVLVLPGQGMPAGDLTGAAAGIDGFAELFAEALRALPAEDRPAVEGLLSGAPADGAEPRLGELALLVQSVVIGRSLLADGLRPSALCGFSLGEFAAGVLAGVFDLGEAAAVVSERARILRDAPPGGMIRVRLAEEALAPYLGEAVSLAIVPGARDCMVSGEAAALAALTKRLRGDRVAAVRVPVAHPYHSAVLSDLLAGYRDVWAKVSLRPPEIRLMSPTEGGWLDDTTACDPGFWAGQLVRPVRFGQAMAGLRADGADLVHVLDAETGITPFVREVFGAAASAMTVKGQAGYDEVSRARLLAAAWTADLDRVAVGAGEGAGAAGPVRVHAPTYVFDHRAQEEQPPMQSEAQSTAESAEAQPAAESAPSRPVLSPARAAAVDAGVRQIVAKLVGLSPQELEADLSFIELGYDSFLLIQLADALSAEYRVDVDVRLLYFDLDSCAALSDHLKGRVAAGGPAEEAAAPATAPAPVPAPVSVSEAVRQPAPAPVVVPPAAQAGPAAVAPLPRPPVPVTGGADGTEPLPAEADWMRRTPLSKRITEEDRFALADQRNLVASRRNRREVSYPVVGARGAGARFTSVDGHEFLDLCMGFGVNLLGHASAPLTAALSSFSPSDLLIGPQSSTAGEVARGIASLTGVDRVAFTSSGTEAVMGAVRAARARTGRRLVVQFSGSYHGTFDGVLVAPRAGGERGESTPLGRGTPPSMVEDVLILPYDESALPVLESYGEQLAAVLVEPVQSRRPGYQPAALLHQLRALTSAFGAALVFDEIITGFRCHQGGAAAYFGVHPDLVTYGKVIGGGMPIGVIAGDAEFMAPIDGGRWREGDVGFPQRPSMVFAGTFGKHPMTMAVAQQMVWHLKKESPRLQTGLTDMTAGLAARINARAAAQGHPLEVEHFSSLFRINVEGGPLAEDMFSLGLRNRGIYVWEGGTCFLSAAHTEADCARIAEAVAETAAELDAHGHWDKVRARRTAGPASDPVPAAVPASEPVPAPVPEPAAGPVAAGEAPLTDGQKLLWMATELGGELGQAYQMSDVLRVEGVVDAERLRRAVERVAARHEAMRTGFDEYGEFQRTVAHAVPDFSAGTLADASAGEVEALLHQHALRPVDLSAPSLFRFHLLQTEDAAFVQATAPHAVVDGWSFQVLWSELSACYLDETAGAALEPPAGFLEYARRKREEEDGRFEAGSARWRERFEKVWASAPLTEDAGPWQPLTRADGLPAQSLADLRGLARASGATRHTAALAAVAVAASLLTGTDQALLMAHQTGQPRYTDRPLMGFCVDLLPVFAELPDAGSLIDVAKGLQRQILEFSPHTSGLYRVLQEQRYRRQPSGLLAFNYEVQPPAGLFGSTATPVVLPRPSSARPATVTVAEQDEGVEVLCEVAGASDLGPHVGRLADTVRQVLAEPAVPLGELRRRARA